MSGSKRHSRLALAERLPPGYLLEVSRFPWYDCGMRFLPLRRILVALVLLTFVGGSWLSAAAEEAPSPCMMAMDACMPMGGDVAKQAPSDRSMPCEKGVPSCAKQLCCLAGAMLLTGAPPSVTLRHSVIRYRVASPQRDGMSVEPELFPPIAS